MCLAQEHNAVTPVRLEPAAPQSPVKHSTTEPQRSLSLPDMAAWVFFIFTSTKISCFCKLVPLIHNKAHENACIMQLTRIRCHSHRPPVMAYISLCKHAVSQNL